MSVFAQNDSVMLDYNKYSCFYNLTSARNINKDSVKCLILVGCDFKDFPKQILHYKNLEALYIGASRKIMITEDMTLNDIKRKDSLHQLHELEFYDLEIDQHPVVKRIPRRIRKLKKLKSIDMLEVKITNIRKFKKIYSYLPNCYIRPNLLDLDDFKNGTFLGE